MGAILPLLDPQSWTQYGSVTPQEAADTFATAFDLAYTQNLCPSNTPAPYWDDSEDVDAEEPPGAEEWYGYVTDPEAPPGELDFVENAIIWAFTGFLALAGTPAAAIAFRTIAPRFVIAMKGDDFGEVIRILVDGEEAARVDTTGHAGEIIKQQIIANPDNETHQIYIINATT